VQSGTLTGSIAGDDVNLGAATATFDTANAGTGKTVTLTGATLIGTAASNYKLTSLANTTTTANITKATVTITGAGLKGSGYFGTYDGQAHEATATVTGVGGVSLGQVVSSTTHTNAGTYTDTVTYTDGTGNYLNASKVVKSYILKATVTISVTGYAVHFDGAAHQATGTATGVNGENLSAGLNLRGTSHTNVGTYTDTVTFTDGTGNYKSASKLVKNFIV
jgi:hypothetical protein